MVSNPTLFVAMPFSEFQELLRNFIKEEFAKLGNTPAEIPKDDLLSIEEAGKLLRASKVTIHKWKKSKLIQSYRIGRKVYFKRHELLAAMNQSIINKKK